MKTKRLLSLLLSVVLLFSSIAVIFRSVSSAVAEEESAGEQIELIDAVFVGKSDYEKPRIANIFFPIAAKKASPDAEETFLEHNNKVNEEYGTGSAAKAHYVYFKLTFKAKMLDGGFYKDKNRVIKESGLGPVVGWIAYDADKKCAAPSTDVYNYRPKSPTSGFPKGSVYTYDAETGLCTVIFRPTINTQSSNIYGAITIGNAEHGAVTSDSKLLGENDFDACFIITEPKLYAYDNDEKETYGDNLFRDGDNNEILFTADNINTDSAYRVDGPDYSAADSILKVPSSGWYVDSGDSLIEKIKVPADYMSSKYDETNFVKHDETDYTREYYTNDNYPGLKFKKLENGNDKAFAVIEDINKKMIVIAANHENSPEGSVAPDYVNANRVANLVCPININQYYRQIVFKNGTLAPSAPQYAPSGRAYFKVTMKAIRLEGEGAPMLGRFYGESGRAKASDYTSYSYNVGEPDSGVNNEAGLPQNTYNPATGEFVGYVRTYLNPSDEKTSKGHSEWLTIGNSERKGTEDTFWSTSFNSSFAITELKVDLYGASSTTIGDLLAEDIGPELFAESIDTSIPRSYRVPSVSQDIYDITGASQKKWTVDGAVDLIHTYDITKCVQEGHFKDFVENPITSTTLENWYCPTCDTYYKDSIGYEKYGTAAEVEAGNLLGLETKMVRIKGTGSSPAYLALPLRLTGFRGHAYFKFSCLYKKESGAEPIFRIYEALRTGQKGGATPDSTVKPVYQAVDPYTNRLEVIFDVWRPADKKYAPFFYTEPDTGGNFLLLLGNSYLNGAGYNAVDINFAISDPQIVRMNGATVESGEMEGVQKIDLAPIADKTVTIDSPYHVGQYKENWYYGDEDSPLAAKLNRWYDIGGDIQLEDIPSRYFGVPQGITFDNTNATISSFQTIQSGKTYSFYYNGKIDTDEVPKPFVEFISSNGTTRKEFLKYETDVNGKYSFKATFTSPSGLRSSRNIRIGIDIGDKEITGKVANFILTEVSATADDTNLLVNGFLTETDELVPYSANAAAGVWMYEGTLGNVIVDTIPGSEFRLPVTYMATFEGTNDGSQAAKDANDGRPYHGYLSQSVTVQKGKTYRVSYNVKYANKGYEEYGSKAGAEFTYISTTGEKTLEVPVVESDEEYKEIYDFTVPDDIVEDENNLKFTFNFWGAFVSGNVANFRMRKLVSGEEYGKNMFVEGNFPDGNYTTGWTMPSSGNYHKFELAEVPENYFSKTEPYAPKMLHFQKTADWSWITSSPMLKPNTNYEWCFNRIFNKYDADKMPTTPANTFIPSNTSMTADMFTSTKSTATFESKKFKTDSNLRLYGNNNMILRYYMRQNSEGYYGNLALYELDDEGKRISGNLYLNGDFPAGYNGFEMSATDMSENTFEEIPEGFFDIPQSFEIQNMEGNISTFATVSANKTYTFYYDGRFYSKEVAKPFVEFISPSGSVTRKYLEATKNTDMKYNFKANFTTPSGLRAAKNIRVGIDIDSKDIDGSVANFSLTGSSGRNLLKKGNFNEVTELVPYADTVDEGIWMYEGDLGDSCIGNYIALTYEQTNPNLLTFVGFNLNTSAAQSANNGSPAEGKITQDFTVKKGKKYRVSYNVKFVNKGYAEYGSKAGAEFTYVTNSGTVTLDVPVIESDEEYRETYEFTVPDDIKDTTKNLTFTFNAWGSFVSGHVANFTMYEIDESGDTVGRNMFVLGDFPKGEYSPGWTKSGSFTIFTFNEIPDNYFNKVTPNQARMLHFQKTADWSWFALSPMLKPDTNYEWCCNRIYESYDSDKKPTTSSSMFKPANTGMSATDFTEIVSGKTFESKKFRTASTVRIYGGNNMILRYYMRQNSVGYYGNLGLYELDEEGNRISGNLFINGDFALDYTCFDISSTNMSSNAFEEIPEGFFDEPTKIQIKNAEGTISTFATVSSKSTYAFYYDGKFDSEKVPKPFVEFISANGNTKRNYLQYDRDINGGYNFQAAFTTPEGLRDAKNIRVGIDVDSTDIEGSVANFSLVEISGDTTGDNILKNGKMIEVKDLIPYSDSVDEGIWMYEGDMGDTVVGASIFGSYKQDVPIMIMFRGKNMNDTEASAVNDGRPCEAKLYQKFTLTPGTKYRISYNVKYVSKGYEEFGSKAGGELLYARASDSSPNIVIPATKTESSTEYRETLDFTMPDDAKEGSTNLQFNFNYWGAFVSGYVTNFTMYEVDAEGNTIGDNLFLLGNFAGSRYYPEWDNSSYSNWTIFQYVQVPEGFFMKDGTYKPKMLYFHNQADWAWFTYSPMLKPDTDYELTSNVLFTDQNSEKISYRSNSMFYPNAEGVMTNTAMSEDAYDLISFKGTVEKKIFHTKPDVRLYGGNNMILRWYMREATAGYYGNIELYELDANGKRVGNNLFLNWDFVAGFKANETFGVVDEWRFVEIPDGFFDNVATKPKTMITSSGSAANANYTVNATIDRFKKQFLEFRYVGMNSAGVTPIVEYPAYDENGNVVYKQTKITSMYDSNRYYYEGTFTLPADAISNNGKTNIRILFNNGNKGKAYFTDIKLYEDGKYIDQITNVSADKSGNFKTVPYDSSVFVFYYDDTMFDDGDWSGERSANAYIIPTGNVTGVVMDDTFAPVSGVRIRLQPGNISTTTDESGTYLFEGLQPGTYKLYLETRGISLYCMDVTVEKGMTFNAPQITFKPNGDAVMDSDDIIESGSNGGEIVGIYYGLDGKPKANVRIYITNKVYAETDKDGRFEFKNLKPNTYKLYVRLGNQFYELRDVTVQAQKRISIKVQEPNIRLAEDLSFFESIEQFFIDYPLYAGLICAGIAIFLGGIVFLIIFLATGKKRKEKKAAKIG